MAFHDEAEHTQHDVRDRTDCAQRQHGQRDVTQPAGDVREHVQPAHERRADIGKTASQWCENGVEGVTDGGPDVVEGGHKAVPRVGHG
ncbi:TPA: hypothetical protein ACHK3A_005236, partial [Escherichia coli]